MKNSWLNRVILTILILLSFCSIVVATPNYTLKDLGKQYQVDWVGNSFPATKIVSNDKLEHVQQEVEDIFVLPNGTVYTNAVWDERFAQASGYKDGEQIVVMDKMLGQGVKGGYAVSAKGKYVYVAIEVRNIDRFRLNKYGKPVYPNNQETWYGVRRYHAKTGKIAGFADGYGEDAGLIVVNSNGEPPQGLAIANRYLYVSDTANNAIKVYDLNNLTQKPTFTWSVDRPGKLTFDREGQLWVAQHQTNRILRFSPEGKLLRQQIVLSQNAIAYDLAVDRQNNLLITDLGKDQNIKIYENITSQPRYKQDFGQKGGIFSDPSGKFAERKFYKPKGIGTDLNGNIYVAQDAWSSVGGGGTIIESYQPNGNLRWRIYSLEFMSSLDIDPQTEEWLYSKERRYQFNPNKQPGQTAVYEATTLNPFKFPNDPRLHEHFTGVHLQYLNNKALLFLRDRNGKKIALFRFDPETDGDIAIPYAMFSSTNVEWIPVQSKASESIWLDKNLNGQFDADEFTFDTQTQKTLKTTDWFIESNGTIWNVAKTLIRKFPMVGFDKNYPIWDFSDTQEFNIPDPFVEVRRIIYDEKTDSIYMTGYTNDSPYTGDWKAIGKKIARFDNWSSSPTLKWIIDAPWYYRQTKGREKSIAVDIEGDYVFIGLESTGKSKDLYQQSTVFVYDQAEGKYIGSMQHQGKVGPIMLDKATGLNVRQTKDGNYLIFLEDAAFARSIIFHWFLNHNIVNNLLLTMKKFLMNLFF